MNVLKYVAFSADPAGGNPAGVVLDATGVDESAMQETAAAVGFSETAFVVPQGGNRLQVRYFSPLAEVPFCGHATIAAAVAYAAANGLGTLHLDTRAGSVTVSTERGENGAVMATLVSVPTRTKAIADGELEELLRALRWSAADLAPALPPRVAYAGAWHPIIAAVDRARLAELDYDLPALADLMKRHDWTTIDLVWRESETVFHARNPFPPGGVVEDPATGAAAAALGGYLRELFPASATERASSTVTVLQGHDMGRPSTITVTIPPDPGSGICVTGTAVLM
jgi:PhzF family phenazine biosynthesis protein